ncbi:hypothetical protein M378DRAFT_78825, partial [Amanita muscaria Koide BX008]
LPKHGAGDVLVKDQSAALNPLDWKIQKFGILIENYPVVLYSRWRRESWRGCIGI